MAKLYEFFSEGDKQDYFKNLAEGLRKRGLSEYQIEREIERQTLAPEKLPTYSNEFKGTIYNVGTYLSEEEYQKAEGIFHMLYSDNEACIHSWILMGFAQLIEDCAIEIDYKNKKVRINDKRDGNGSPEVGDREPEQTLPEGAVLQQSENKC